MKQRLIELRERTRDGHFARYRQAKSPQLVEECDAEGLSWSARRARLTKRMCEAERAVIEPDERIVFTRTLRDIPEVFSSAQCAALTEGWTLHEGGNVNNVCADWGLAIAKA